jgi:DNA-binding FadR family transcriptional regulator
MVQASGSTGPGPRGDLAGAIVSGAAPLGSALPVEPELGETSGASRITIREAGKSPEVKGLIIAR